MRVAIHQPNLMPWFPFFQKMAMVDVFVIIAGCPYEKGGYQNRFELCGEMYTMPVNRGLEPIYDKRYVDSAESWGRIVNKARMRNTRYANVLSGFSSCVCDSLAETNIAIIRRTARDLGLRTRIHADSDTADTGTARLVRICEEYGADTYVAGPSWTKYMDATLFAERGIMVETQTAQMQDRRHTLEVVCG